MRKHWLIFYAFSLCAAFCVGILSQHIPFVISKAKQYKMCVGNNTCQRGPLSIFSKKLAEEAAATAPTRPAGFCLPVPVLLYHHVQPQADAVQKGQTSLSVDSGIFDQQMGYLASHGYNAISADTLVNAILSHGSLPAKPVVITLDDAYLDNYTYAYPSFQKYHLIGNLMVPTGLLGGNGGTNSYFSWDQLKQMVGSGLLFVYNHTWSHYSMGAGPKDKDTYEITTAQKQLQQNLGKTSPVFVYPYGSGQTTGWVQDLLKENGFVAAFSTIPGVFQCEGNIMSLPRLHIGNAPLSSYGL